MTVVNVTSQKTYNINQKGTDKKYAVIPTKHQKYSSTTILKHVDVLAKVNKSPYAHLLYMTPHGAYIIKIHVCKMTISEIGHEQNL